MAITTKDCFEHAWASSGKSIPTDLLILTDSSSDIGETFPNGQLASYFGAEPIIRLIKETRSTRDFSERTRQTAKWARQVVKAQTGQQGA